MIEMAELKVVKLGDERGQRCVAYRCVSNHLNHYDMVSSSVLQMRDSWTLRVGEP